MEQPKTMATLAQAMKLHASHAALSEGVSTARRTRLPLSQVKPHAAAISHIGGQTQPSANSSHNRQQEQQPKNSPRPQFELSCCCSSSCCGGAAARFWDASGRSATQTSTNSSSVDCCCCTLWLAIRRFARENFVKCELVVVGLLSCRRTTHKLARREKGYIGCVQTPPCNRFLAGTLLCIAIGPIGH